jgi:hypothetical protein
MLEVKETVIFHNPNQIDSTSAREEFGGASGMGQRLVERNGA